MAREAGIRLMIADSNMLVHMGLTGMLESCEGITLVGTAFSAAETFARLEEAQPDVIILDAHLPDMDSLEAIRSLRAAYPGVKVLVLSIEEDSKATFETLAAGAMGYLMKNITPYELERAIHLAAQGRLALAPEAARALLIYSQGQREDHLQQLTEREHEILGHMAHGLSNSQIAAKLAISPFTVKAHVSNILAKLGATTRAEAAAYAVQRRLVKLS